MTDRQEVTGKVSMHGFTNVVHRIPWAKAAEDGEGIGASFFSKPVTHSGPALRSAVHEAAMRMRGGGTSIVNTQ